MKVLLAGDTHGDREHIEYLAEVAKSLGIDRVFVLGDFGAWEHFDWGVEFFDHVDFIAEKLGLVFYFLDGNHDKTSLILRSYRQRDDEGFLICRPRLRYARRGHRWRWGDTSFIALGGAYSVDKDWRLAKERHEETSLYTVWNTMNAESTEKILARPDFDRSGTYWFPEEEMTDEQLNDILTADPSPVDVMLTHDKPRGSNPSFNRKTDVNCFPNQDRIQKAMLRLKPKRLVHGHLHFMYTQTIRCGDDDQSTQVDGLSCNPEAQEWTGRAKDVRLTETWLALDC